MSSPWRLDAFDEVKSLGRDHQRDADGDQTAIAIFWTANVVRPYNGLAHSIATKMSLDVPHTSRCSR